MATHSNILPWEISWTEGSGGLQSISRNGFPPQQPRTLDLGKIVAMESQNHQSMQIPIIKRTCNGCSFGL